MVIAMAEDSTDIDDLSLDDLSGIFYDDKPTDTETTTVTSSHALEMELATSANAPFELFEPLETQSAVGSSASVLSLSQVGSACASLAPISLESRRRRSSQNRGADGEAPAEGWHSEAEDRTHRQRMIHEVARLLHARKKTQPSAEWLQQLPHKARKLEERLYWSAPSAADYLEMSTLKNRLRRVADTISKKYTEAKRIPRRSSAGGYSLSSSQSSRASFSSLNTSDSSQGSIDSLQSLRNSFLQKSNFLPNIQQHEHQQQQQQQHQQQQPHQQQQMELQQLRQQQQEQLRQQQQAETHSSSSNRGSTQPRNSFSGSTMNGLSPIPESRFVELGNDSGHASSSSSASGTNIGTASTSKTNTNSVSHGAAGNTGSESKEILNLERQKAINASLQQQIQENIRRQEELVRQLQERGQAPAPVPSAPAPIPSSIQSAPGSRNMSGVRGMQGADQLPSNMSIHLQGQGDMNMNMHMQGQVADQRTNNVHMQGNEMNRMAGAPFGMNSYAAQNTFIRQAHGDVTQSGGGQYNPMFSANPFSGQGRMGMESFEQSAAVMSNPQLSRLLAANPSLFASAQQQQQQQQQNQSMVQPFDASSAPVGGFNPSMPPPNSSSLAGNSAPTSPPNGGNRGRNGDESLLPDSPLSPNSFHW